MLVVVVVVAVVVAVVVVAVVVTSSASSTIAVRATRVDVDGRVAHCLPTMPSRCRLTACFSRTFGYPGTFQGPSRDLLGNY